jgi:hypothetical protein
LDGYFLILEFKVKGIDMKRFYFGLSVIVSSLLSLFIGMNVHAAQEEVTATTTTTTQSPDDGTVTKVVETRRAVVTPVPVAKEVIATPQGFVSCATVEAGWYNDLWVPSHKVCAYNNTAEGVAWVEGYWGCNKATPEGVCTNWEWKAGHWQKTMINY